MRTGTQYPSYLQRGAVRPRAACLYAFLIVLWLGAFLVSDHADAQERSSVAYHGVEWCSTDCHAQPVAGTPDQSLLRWVNARETPLFTGWMEVADASFYPATFGSVPMFWGVAALGDDVEYQNALAYSVGWAGTAASTIVLKRIIKRDRPYVNHSDLIIRYSPSELAKLGDQSSMPSGHTSMSVFSATYLIMETTSVPIRVASGLWASSVALSRVWNGVHFPSDVVAGAVLGGGFAVLARQFY